MAEHVLSLSYGKDSLACLGAIEELGWPLDRIIHVEVWATDTIPADLPPMVEFKEKADAIIKGRYGIEVEHYCAKNIDGEKGEKVTYQDGFYHVLQKGKKKGTIKGFPMQRGPWCQKLKLDPFKHMEASNGKFIQYLGIAVDEPGRFSILSHIKKSPLVEAGWTEQRCREWCEDNSLLSPIYTDSARGGCWFCHNQGIQQLRMLRRDYPEYWALMLKWDDDSPVTFKAPSTKGAKGHTVHDFELRFQLEDDGLLSPDDKVFRWNMLEEPLNFRMF